MSRAVASPVLIRKLQCISDTCAPPTRMAAHAGRIDQFPGTVPGRILEGRAAGLLADRLHGLAVGLHLVHARADRLRLGDAPTKRRAEVKITEGSTPLLR